MLASTEVIYLDEPKAAAPECTERRHEWSIDRGHRDTGNGALIFQDECAHCQSRRLRRRSYLGIDADGPTGDGRDYTRYRQAHRLQEAAPDSEPPTEAELDEAWNNMNANERHMAVQLARASMGAA